MSTNVTDFLNEINESLNKGAGNSTVEKDAELPDDNYNVKLIKIEVNAKYKKVLWVLKVLDGMYRDSITSLWTPITGEYAFITKLNMYHAGYPLLNEKESALYGKEHVDYATQLFNNIEQMNEDMPTLQIELKTKGEHQNKKILGVYTTGKPEEEKKGWKEDSLKEDETKVDNPITKEKITNETQKVKDLFK